MVRPSRAQKSFAEMGLTYDINMDGVIDALVAGHAMTHSLDDMRYVDAVMDRAFQDADDVFNEHADAMGAQGAIKHMYDWGTIGINNARTNVRRQPSAPGARLWTNFTEGNGLNRSLFYAFRPSVANVPKPTVRDTGMKSEVIARMRDYVFRWKAEVIENGETVTIAPKRKFLLIPAYEQNRAFMRPYDLKRGYKLLQNPVTVTPGGSGAGGKGQGTFTAFWRAYWNHQGEDILQARTTEMILEDYEPEFYEKRTPKTLRPVRAMNIHQKVKVDSKKLQKKKILRARKRVKAT